MTKNISRMQFMRMSGGFIGATLANQFLPAVNTTAMSSKVDFQKRSMILRTIPSSGEKLPAIGMGTWLTFDAGDSETRRKDLKDVLRIFKENGGKLIDSSPMYGSSEKVVGELMADLQLRKQLFVATKVWTNGETNGIEQMQKSIQKMQAGVMDLMQVHNLLDAKAHLPTLRKWKAERKIRYIGLTHYTVSAYSEIMELIKNEKPDFVQFNYNIRVRDAEKKLLPFCADHGVAVINNRPFDGGDLFTKVLGKEIPPWIKEHDIQNWAEFFLKYIISHPAVTCAIPATSNPAHMKENIGAAYGFLPDVSIRKKMADFFEKL